MSQNAVGKITPQQLNEKLEQGEKLLLLDVREDYEREISKLNNDFHIPMAELQSRFSEVDASQTVVVYCRSGGRSMAAAGFLVENGFSDVFNLEGGINGWAQSVDSNMATY